jgi:hypothetical protein
VKDSTEQKLAMFISTMSWGQMLTRNEARCIAGNIKKLPELFQRKKGRCQLSSDRETAGSFCTPSEMIFVSCITCWLSALYSSISR